MDETIRTMTQTANVSDKMRKTDILLVLRALPGGPKESSPTGITKNRLFTGQPHVRAVMDKQTTLWHFVSDGILPQPLRNRWTSFSRAYNFAKDYYKRRNVEIAEIID